MAGAKSGSHLGLGYFQRKDEPSQKATLDRGAGIGKIMEGHTQARAPVGEQQIKSRSKAPKASMSTVRDGIGRKNIERKVVE